MFSAVQQTICIAQIQFADNVRDQFGLSLVTEVYEPYRGEVAALEQMDSEMEQTLSEIDRLIDEARLIKG